MIIETSPSFVTEILMMMNGTLQAVLKKNKQALGMEAVSFNFKVSAFELCETQIGETFSTRSNACDYKPQLFL